MRIVDRADFLAQPPGTLFSTYEPCVLGPLSVKDESMPSGDFFYVVLQDAVDASGTEQFIEQLELSERSGHSAQMDFEVVTRDGLMDPGQRFAIWERDDVAALARKLAYVLRAAYGE